MQFPDELRDAAHRTASGEYAWRRPHALRAAKTLRDAGMAVLGGELWLVGGEAITGLLPTPDGQTSVYRWVSERRPSEAWPAFVARSYADTIAAIQSLPRVGELDFSVGGEIYYNLVWADETA